MVNKYHNKRLRYCRHCNHRHPEKRACRGPLQVRKINNTKRYFAKTDQSVFDQWEDFKDKVRDGFGNDCVMDFMKRSYKKDLQKQKKQSRSQQTPPDFYIRKDKKNKPQLPIQECPVCLVEKRVRVLGCRHSVCQDCWNSILCSDSCGDTCPTCRSDLFQSENYYNYAIDEAFSSRTYRLERLEWEETPFYNMLMR